MLPDLRELSEQLTAACERHGVPGAVLGVDVAGRLRVAAHGVVRLPDGAAVTPDTLFLIGSITKVWTATLVMQLVDQGAVELDAPVQRYLEPPLALADQEVADTVTVRQLLSHTGGFLGDSAELPDRGDDAVARTVASYAKLAQLFRPGRLFSYSNTGYNVLGRLIECLTDSTWDAVLSERLLTPLGLEQATTLPEQALVHPVAIGHETDGDGRPVRPVKTWAMPRGDGPCGGTLAMSAADLLAFARLHLADGRAPSGQTLLSHAAARTMRTPQVGLPDPLLGSAWGIGWAIEHLTDPLVVGHSGSVGGQQARLLVVPERDLSICMLTNGDPSTRARHEVLDALLERLAGAGLASAATPSGRPVDPAVAEAVAGRYTDGELELVVSARDGQLLVREVDPGEEGLFPASDSPLDLVDATTFVARVPDLGLDAGVTFVSEDGHGARPTHVVIVGHAIPRAE